MKFYVDLSCWYYAIGIVGSILLLPLLFVMFPNDLNDMKPFLIWLVCMLIWATCCTIFFQSLAVKRLNKLARVRAEECRIEDFKNAWEEFRNQKHFFYFNRAGIIMNKS